ncbi:MAG: glyoxalase/bleomycin resistance/extradiol dioxygenase family protein [Verrucomicrobia bacterium CG_4_10_14_3_um_filter_43_23]|nr:MAG: hypothetical protein AUJ82_00450 [Verrucomicrobia bacterium CG1_02_43_26]PIP59256.1 MAG: glyoxalase/bleomycin resistance/extradiol dioxygenase family protein [Verrucomicrobia bacterium CG22_combo_CG10-13_8_21_14_all_43_17]PIX58560.1 MAG: glyoxalase/bleomycin resistance/extradiol dioxygenase family protein [Verrucomicrobia bacterium CG_4_10_14_3_um_filter_43_23]PIY61012.1 MAG: glyoxalase/bleomycin resistance/extradiol dioxygenase family protein [Verrucomicrobia bacterium CG_4_10_14_0_8_um
MLDHLSIAVNDFEQSMRFYDETLAILGIERLMTFNEYSMAGYGEHGKPFFWIGVKGNADEYVGKARGLHIAFHARSQSFVDEWYKHAIKLGAVCNGTPSMHLEYHAHYYAAYVIDPNGWRLEAVNHGTHWDS